MKINDIEILNEDSIEFMKGLADESIDLIVTDPPYPTTKRGSTGNSGGMCKKKEFSQGKVFKHNNVKPEEYIPEFYRTLKEGSHCYIMTNHINLIKILNVATDSGFHFIKSLIWNKGNKIMGQAYMSQFEYILFFRKGKFKKINHCGTSDILDVPNKKTKDEHGENLHDTEKPVELMKILIGNSSQEGELVFDPFGGIGATPLACLELNRRCISIEIDDTYFEIKKKRIEDYTKRRNDLCI